MLFSLNQFDLETTKISGRTEIYLSAEREDCTDTQKPPEQVELVDSDGEVSMRIERRILLQLSPNLLYLTLQMM